MCAKCNPEFTDSLVEQAESEAQATYEQTITQDAMRALYDAAVARHRKEVEAAAYADVLEGIKAEVKAEVVTEYESGLRTDLENKWTEGKRDEMRKEVREAFLAQMKAGM